MTPDSGRIDTSPVTVSTTRSTDRQTPKTDFGTRIRVGVSEAAGAVGNAASIAAPFVPGGAIVSAAIAGVTSQTASPASIGPSPTSSTNRIAGGAYLTGGGMNNTAGTASSPYGTGSPSGIPSGAPNGAPTGSGLPFNPSGDQWSFLEATKQSQMQFLALQSTMNQEAQQYMTLSNIMKVRHDAAKNTISNVH